MKLAVRRTSMAVAAVATAGVSSLFVGIAPASAAGTEACGATGTVVGPGICEQTFTSGTVNFTPTASMTKLEVLLVGGGGGGASAAGSSSTGYATAGGGGEVTITDFSGATAPLTGSVPQIASAATITDGTKTATASAGAFGEASKGGESGNGKAGANVSVTDPAPVSPQNIPYAGGGGAGSAAVSTPTKGTNANGGNGVRVSDIAPSGSLFADDTACYGGGGAVAVAGLTNVDDALGTPGCGGGSASSAAATGLTAPVANSGGGGGAYLNATGASEEAGAAGLVVIRWTAANVTLSFNADGHGTAPASQTLPAGTAPTKPADPIAEGYTFGGWFTDSGLTTAADFSKPITASTTFYAKWTATLAATGAPVNPIVPGAAAGGLLLGAALIVVAARRRRQGQAD